MKLSHAATGTLVANQNNVLVDDGGRSSIKPVVEATPRGCNLFKTGCPCLALTF